MASKPGMNEFAETCECCERTTQHTVSVRLRTESSKPDNAQFSREPYRVAECRICGTVTEMRMNNA